MEKRVALVTGAARGIGRCIARHLQRQGWGVVGMDLDPPDDGELEPVTGDVAREDDVRRAVQAALDRFGRLDGLVNNAGIMVRKPLAELSLDDWHRVLGVNLTGAFLCTKHAAPHLKGGAIVNIASSRAVMSEPDTEAYAASKGGLVALTHASALSLGPEVRVNAVSPGWIEVRENATHSREDREQHPVGRVGAPEDVAALVAFLLSDQAGFITGAHYVIDGGMTRKMIYAE